MSIRSHMLMMSVLAEFGTRRRCEESSASTQEFRQANRARTCNARESARGLSPRSVGTADVSPRSLARTAPSRIGPGDPAQSSAPGKSCRHTSPRPSFSVVIIVLAPLLRGGCSRFWREYFLSSYPCRKGTTFSRDGLPESAGNSDFSGGNDLGRENPVRLEETQLPRRVMLDSSRSTSSAHFRSARSEPRRQT